MPIPSMLLVGNCVIDDIYRLPGYPAEDDEIRALSHQRRLGGNASNSAQTLAALGHPVSLAVSMANDELAHWALDKLEQAGIDTGLCRRQPGFASPHSTIWTSEASGSRTIVHHRDLPELSVAELDDLPVQRFDWIHFEGRNIESLAAWLAAAGTDPARCSLEIEKPRDGIEQLVSHCHTVIVSSQYLLAKDIDAQQCIAQLAQINLRARIVCTLGRRGLAAMDTDRQPLRIAAREVDTVVDSVGAGDCFIAGLISRLSQGWNFAKSLEFANHLAATKIQHPGMTIQ